MTHALRSLARTPGFTAVAIVTLALGLGLTTAMFSLVNALLLRPLPFRDSEQLVRLHRVSEHNSRDGFSPADYLDLKRAEPGFGQFSGYDHAAVSVAAPGQPPELQSAIRTGVDYFAVLGLQPELGRTFTAEEETYGRHRVVVLSHAFWHERFSGSTDVIGQTLRIDGEPHEIVGVMSASASNTRVIRQAKLFRPLSFTETERASRGNRRLHILGRRASDLTEAQG
ncbi:MAG TPA: ABC transporter permease, partial [Candidatus Synoicihabitans sp.]|nr:ABC transporter permease [Candidatus Synoicihabitans sp.]